MTLRVWSDHPEFKACETLKASDFIELSGEFQQHQQFGLDARKWKVRHLTPQERSELLQGPPELRAKQLADWNYIGERIRALGDPRLRALCEAFLSEHGERFRRTAGARSYHHARRGGLVEHTAQMMRVAKAIAPLYPQLNLDLLIAGVLFHDSGKLWENHLPETGFTMGYDERGELIGHISIGLELVNSLWRKIQSEENARAWNALVPASEDVRMHLLHLIGAHHGEPQFGSPVSPKTPEAMALNYIDNLDARHGNVLRRLPRGQADRRSDLRSRPAVAGKSGEAAGKIQRRRKTAARSKQVICCSRFAVRSASDGRSPFNHFA